MKVQPNNISSYLTYIGNKPVVLEAGGSYVFILTLNSLNSKEVKILEVYDRSPFAYQRYKELDRELPAYLDCFDNDLEYKWIDIVVKEVY